jgi:hypothetical protein
VALDAAQEAHHMSKQFDDRSIQRISEAVRRSERAIRNRPVRTQRRGGVGGGGGRWAEVTLTEAMGATTTDEAAADVDAYVGADPGASITVLDRQSQFGRAPSGAAGLAAYDPADDAWFLVRCGQLASVCKALIDEASGVATSDTDFQVDNVDPIGDGLGPTASDAAELTVENIYAMEGDDNAPVLIVWNATESQWECHQMKCPA